MSGRSKYYNYFHIAEGKASCKRCAVVFPYSSRIGTNSLRNHIRNKHSELFDGISQTNIEIKSENLSPDQTPFPNDNNNEPAKPKSRKRKSATPILSPNSFDNGFDLAKFLSYGCFDLSKQDPTYMGQIANCITQVPVVELPMTSEKSPEVIGNDAQSDVEIIVRNLSSIEGALFYLKTTSEILRKWPTTRVRVFLQDLLKKAMDEDNQMLFPSI